MSYVPGRVKADCHCVELADLLKASYCAHCLYWFPYYTAGFPNTIVTQEGECRRHSPVVSAVTVRLSTSYCYSCGDHSQDSLRFKAIEQELLEETQTKATDHD